MDLSKAPAWPTTFFSSVYIKKKVSGEKIRLVITQVDPYLHDSPIYQPIFLQPSLSFFGLVLRQQGFLWDDGHKDGIK